MASDDSRPKVRMLFTIGIVSVFLLVGVKFLLDSYYFDMTETYEHTLIPPTTVRDDTKKEQLAAIDDGQNGAIPVNVAMQQLEKGRDNIPEIQPQPSEDLDPLKGWAKLKHEVQPPPAMQGATQPTEAADAGATNVAGDAGAAPTTTGDAGAGAHHAAAADAGAPHAAPHAPAQTKDGGK